SSCDRCRALPRRPVQPLQPLLPVPPVLRSAESLALRLFDLRPRLPPPRLALPPARHALRRTSRRASPPVPPLLPVLPPAAAPPRRLRSAAERPRHAGGCSWIRRCADRAG